MKKLLFIIPIIPIVFVIFIVLLIVSSSGNDTYVTLINGEFKPPFSPEVRYRITSKFGTRIDPFTDETTFHSGIDVTANEGSDIVASANGIVVETGFEENGLGNYVYIEHNINGVIYYTGYGHMLDDSIVVTEGQPVQQYEKIGTIGSTGKSTGIHCHFMLMTPKLEIKKKYLIDPEIIFTKEGMENEKEL